MAMSVTEAKPIVQESLDKLHTLFLILKLLLYNILKDKQK